VDAITDTKGPVRLDASVAYELDDALFKYIDMTRDLIKSRVDDMEPEAAVRFAAEWLALESLRATLPVDPTITEMNQ
jgi:hypothetical protein